MAQLTDDHPAKRTLILHAECQRDCLCREMPWKNYTPVDQEWDSATDGRRWKFSSFTYSFIAFCLILDGWVKRPGTLTASEQHALAKIPMMRRLLSECETASMSVRNLEVLRMIAQVRTFLDVWEEAIRERVRADCLPVP